MSEEAFKKHCELDSTILVYGERAKKHANSKYRFTKSLFKPITFHHVSGIDLDGEVKEFVQGTDLIKHQKDSELNYVSIQR